MVMRLNMHQLWAQPSNEGHMRSHPPSPARCIWAFALRMDRHASMAPTDRQHPV